MTRLIRLLIASTLALGLAVLPAAAVEEPDCYAHDYDEDGNPIGPEFCTLQAWFTPADTRVGNVAAVADDGYPSWDTTPPASMESGAGGMTATAGTLEFPYEPAISVVFEGEFTGPIDTIAVELFGFFSPWPVLGPDIWLMGELWIDETLVGRHGGYQEIPVHLSDLNFGSVRFVLEDIDTEMGFEGLDRGPEAEHTVRLVVSPVFPALDDAVWVYGAEEAPSSIIFNITDGKDAYTSLPLW